MMNDGDSMRRICVECGQALPWSRCSHDADAHVPYPTDPDTRRALEDVFRSRAEGRFERVRNAVMLAWISSALAFVFGVGAHTYEVLLLLERGVSNPYVALGILLLVFLVFAALLYMGTGAFTEVLARTILERVLGEPYLRDPHETLVHGFRDGVWATIKQKNRNWVTGFSTPTSLRYSDDLESAMRHPSGDIYDTDCRAVNMRRGQHNFLESDTDETTNPELALDEKIDALRIDMIYRDENLAQLPDFARNQYFFNLDWYLAWKAARGRGVPPASDPCWNETGRS